MGGGVEAGTSTGFGNYTIAHKTAVVTGAPRALHNTKGYSSTYLAMGFANVRAGTWYPPEH